MVQKAQRRVELERTSSTVETTNLTRSSQFFKVIQDGQKSNKDDLIKKKAVEKKVLQRKVKL